MLQNEWTWTLVSLVKLCFHWLIRSDFMAMIGQRVSTPLCTHKHTHTPAHSNTMFALLPALRCLAGIISSYGAKGSKVTTAWQHSLHVLPLLCSYVCVLSTWQRDLFDQVFSPGVFLHVYIAIHSLYILHCFHSPPLLAKTSYPASIPAPPFLLIPPTSHSHLSS